MFTHISMNFPSDTPVCSPGQKREYQVAHHETANITCRVDSVPDNVTFTWKFNSSGSLLELGEGRAASWGTTSVLAYTPASPGDYGLLLCTATNSIGTQHLPCVINVTAASKYKTVCVFVYMYAFVRLYVCKCVCVCVCSCVCACVRACMRVSPG